MLQQDHLPGEDRGGLWVPLTLEYLLGEGLTGMGKESKNSGKMDRKERTVWYGDRTWGPTCDLCVYLGPPYILEGALGLINY